MKTIIIFIFLFNVTFAQLEPKLKWERIYDGLGHGLDMMNVALVDDEQNICVAGRSENESPGHALVILKYSKLGEMLYEIRYTSNNSSWNEAYSIALDSAKNIYCIGVGSFNTSSSIGVIQKYSATGELVWHKDFLNHYPTYSEGIKILVDSDENVVAGYNLNGACITKYSSSGDSLWSYIIENDTSDYTVIEMINDGNSIYALIKRTTYQGGEFPDVKEIIYKLNYNGEIIWQKGFEYSTMDKMILDKNKNLILKGYESEKIIKVSPAGEIIWGKDVNGLITDIKFDSENNLYYCGYGGGYKGIDMIIGKLTENGNLLWSNYYNSVYDINDFGHSITVDDSNYVYVAMSAHNSTSIGSGYILKYGINGELKWEFEYNNPEYMFDLPFYAFVDDSMNIYTVGEISRPSDGTNLLILKVAQEIKTDVESEDVNISTFRLSQNYPNPFNPSTNINFSLPKSEFVTLKIYDVLGKEITTLINEEMNVGSHTKIWDAQNLSSGVYFYKLNAGSYNETKKMILVR